MRLRSLLFVPGDRPERFGKALASGADGIILDLEDSVVLARKDAARDAVAGFLAKRERGEVAVLVRINPLDLDMTDADLAAARGADVVMLPKASGGDAIDTLAALLGEDPAQILPIASETPAAVFTLGTYAGRPRLAGLTWGAEDLPAAIGATASREPDGGFGAPYQMVRSLALFGAHAAGVPAIETVFADFRDLDGAARQATRGARDGFTGMLAIHPTQVAPINDAFTPSENAVAEARAIAEAFAASPDAGALNLGGRMIDAPHLKLARRILAAAGGADPLPLRG